MRRHGRIKSRRPNMIAAANVIAARVAGMVAPDNADDIFSMLKNRVGDRYNAHSQVPLSSGYKSTARVVDDISGALKGQISSETRDQLAQRTGLPLANLAYKPKTGVATAAQIKPRTGEQQQTEFGAYQTYGSQQQQTSDPNMVDDAGWSKTLAQTVGSGMISAAQFQAASFANVGAMLGTRTSSFNGATAGALSNDEKTEMTYMLQRMILEGYVRGVDIPAMIKNMNGGQLKLATSDGAGLGLGVAGYNIGAMFDKTWWSKASDIDKIGLFYQEVGHALGVAPHTRGLMEGNDTIFSADDQAKKMYGQYLDYYFEDVKAHSSYDVASSKANALTSDAAAALINKNKDWLPSLTGVIGAGKTTTATTTPTYRTGSISKSSLEAEESTIPILNPSFQNAPTESSGGNGLDLPTSELSESVMDSTKTFAKDMADISKPNPTNTGAGALLTTGS